MNLSERNIGKCGIEKRFRFFFLVCAVCRLMSPSKTLQMKTRHKSWEPLVIGL